MYDKLSNEEGDAVERTKRELMLGFNHRHHDSVRYAKKLVSSIQYGDVLWMRGRYGKSVSPDFYDDWRSEKKYAGGGIFWDQGIHMLDLFMMMVGPFDEVKAFVSNVYWKGDIEDNVFAIFRNVNTGLKEHQFHRNKKDPPERAPSARTR